MMTALHATIADIILDPSDNRLYEETDGICWQVWEYCLQHGVTPWGWCLDRYCSCKLMLSEHEPEPLPGLRMGGAGQERPRHL